MSEENKIMLRLRAAANGHVVIESSLLTQAEAAEFLRRAAKQVKNHPGPWTVDDKDLGYLTEER